jgi:hypothetical protein
MATYNVVDLWRTLRGLENSYRYYADVIAGIIQHHPLGENLTFEARKSPARGWMNLCLPPMCVRSIEEISEELDFMAGKAKAVKELVTDLSQKLKTDNPPITQVQFFATELPGTRLLIDMADWDPDVQNEDMP